MRRGIKASVLEAERQWDFDLIAGKSPDFFILETAAEIAQQIGKPFLAIYDDPHGRRDDQHFYPLDQQKQIQLLKQAAGVIFMSPMTRDRYISLGLVDAAKTYSMTDSYPLNESSQTIRDKDSHSSLRFKGVEPKDTSINMVHLGNLPEWRPINTFIKALDQLLSSKLNANLKILFYGYVYEGSKELIKSNPAIANQCQFFPAVSHQQSHNIAEASDLLLVMIGRRHRDNQPSKFFVYLGHHKPVLVVGPLGNPIQTIVQNLGIGVYADVDHPDSIEAGMRLLIDHYEDYVKAFEINQAKIQAFSVKSVANRWIKILDQIDTKSSSQSPLY